MKCICIITTVFTFVFCSVLSAAELQYSNVRYAIPTGGQYDLVVAEFSNGIHIIIGDTNAVLDKSGVAELSEAIKNPDVPVTVKGLYSYDVQLRPFNKGGYKCELKTVSGVRGFRVLLTASQLDQLHKILSHI